MNEILVKAMAAAKMTDVALAAQTGVSPGMICKVRHKRARPSPELVLKIEAALGGAVTRSDLRPDVYPPSGEPSALPALT